MYRVWTLLINESIEYVCYKKEQVKPLFQSSCGISFGIIHGSNTFDNGEKKNCENFKKASWSLLFKLKVCSS